MRFSVRHETLYRYARPVRLAPHLLRLTPRPEAAALVSHELAIEPAPSSRTEAADAFGNLVTHLAFDRETEVFRILSRFEADVRPPAAPVAANLASYLADPRPDPGVRAFAERLADEAGERRRLFSIAQPHALRRLPARHPRRRRRAHAAETLALRHGACRDVTVLFLAACRSLGIPARFVSGYQARAQTPDGRRHLHAWAEAHLPEGWRGYDPTHGVAVTDGHVALCAAPDQAATMPVEGGYWGEAVESS